jgi:hypothetical protein
MIPTKDISAITSKWSNRAQAAAPDYTAGVKATQKDWAGNTAAAADSWQQGVSEAAANGRFAKGATAAGTEKWRNAAATKGSQRFGQGVAAGSTNYNAGFTPYLSVIQSTNLPPRSPRGSPNNIQRVTALAAALHNKKISG